MASSPSTAPVADWVRQRPAGRPATVRLLGSDDPGEGQAVLTPLAGPGTLITAVAPDALRLRRLLNAAAEAAGPPAGR